jgi:hypothetical protein
MRRRGYAGAKLTGFIGRSLPSPKSRGLRGRQQNMCADYFQSSLKVLQIEVSRYQEYRRFLNPFVLAHLVYSAVHFFVLIAASQPRKLTAVESSPPY